MHLRVSVKGKVGELGFKVTETRRMQPVVEVQLGMRQASAGGVVVGGVGVTVPEAMSVIVTKWFPGDRLGDGEMEMEMAESATVHLRR